MKYGIFALALFVAAPLSAQTVSNPTVVSFTASPDHSVVVSGVPVLDRYELNTMIGTSTGALSWTQDLGKPTPTSTNTIEVAVPRFATLSRGTYVVTVSAVGPGGVTPSAASDPFLVTGSPAGVGKPIVIRK